MLNVCYLLLLKGWCKGSYMNFFYGCFGWVGVCFFYLLGCVGEVGAVGVGGGMVSIPG